MTEFEFQNDVLREYWIVLFYSLKLQWLWLYWFILAWLWLDQDNLCYKGFKKFNSCSIIVWFFYCISHDLYLIRVVVTITPIPSLAPRVNLELFFFWKNALIPFQGKACKKCQNTKSHHLIFANSFYYQDPKVFSTF